MKWIRCITILFLSALIVSCDNKSNDAKKNATQFVKSLENASTIKKEIKDENIEMKPIVYEGAKLRDPFEIPAMAKTAAIYPNAILTNTALDTLKLSGVMMRDNEEWAILRANNGNLYKVTKGMRVGIQQALVKRVEQDRVIFLLNVETDSKTGAVESREITMTLQQKEPKK